MINIEDDYEVPNAIHTKHKTISADNELFYDFSKMKSEQHGSTQTIKHVLIIYCSGSAGANEKLEIPRGYLERQMSKNFYLNDSQYFREKDEKEFLITPLQENGYRIAYKIQETKQISSSINLTLQKIEHLAHMIGENYDSYDSFLIITGMDTICYVGSALSFMLENLDKLVVCTGGLLPFSKMRNDLFSNLIESFSVISEASSLNQVLIVSKNKGLRANRCKKFKEADFQNIFSPNLKPLCSIKPKLTVRYSLFEPKPTEPFAVFPHLSKTVKVLKIQMYENLQSLEYNLNNPNVKGYIIEGYSFANMPQNQEILSLFKKAHEERKTIFITLSESVYSKNKSIMGQELEKSKIYFGGDMTLETAIAKLSYLIAKDYPTEQIIKLMQKNMRGELTEVKDKIQFEKEEKSLRCAISDVLDDHYPTTLQHKFLQKLESSLGNHIIDDCSVETFKKTYWDHKEDQKTNEQLFVKIAESSQLLHRAVEADNIEMVKYFLSIGVNVNSEDEEQCSPLYYALIKLNKSLIRMLVKKEARVIAPVDSLFKIFIDFLKKDDVSLFELLYHMEFKNTLKEIVNSEKRNAAHLAASLKAEKCYKIIKQQFNVPVNLVDIYEKTALSYLGK